MPLRFRLLPSIALLALLPTLPVAAEPPARGLLPTAALALSPSALAAAMASGGNALDAVIDVRRAHADGLMVLAVTPGGTGDRIGLRVGDRILEVNGRPLTDTLEPSRVMAEAMTVQRPLELRVSRDGRALTLTGTAATADSDPAPEGCGYVTTRGTLPHVSDRLYPVEIIDIDGGGRPIDANRHRLPAGLHVVIVSERIEDIRFDPVQRTQRSRMLSRLGARAGKALVIEVRPDTRYRLGARFLDRDLGSRTISENAYWEPLVWQEVEDPCR
ncbi:PDZ domain-containing protein [Marilutibacter chinensis]|nr:PDZ domain-containing protein [Lysobacter chinensis]